MDCCSAGWASRAQKPYSRSRCSSPTAGGAAANWHPSPMLSAVGTAVLGPSVALVGRLAARPCHHSADHSVSLASSRMAPDLGIWIAWPLARWPPKDREGAPGPDCPHQSRELPLGCVEDPCRVTETGVQSFPSDGLPLYAETRQASISGLANLPLQPSCGGDHFWANQGSESANRVQVLLEHCQHNSVRPLLIRLAEACNGISRSAATLQLALQIVCAF